MVLYLVPVPISALRVIARRVWSVTPIYHTVTMERMHPAPYSWETTTSMCLTMRCLRSLVKKCELLYWARSGGGFITGHYFSLMMSGVNFSTGYCSSLIIQILWNICCAVHPFLSARSLQIFAHAMTVVLSWHVQNFVVIPWLKMGWEQSNASIKLGLWLKKCQGLRAWIRLTLPASLGSSSGLIWGAFQKRLWALKSESS